ncbi:putative polyketide synthase [Xylogone sp. PMI_703]|nr:putative polyketide synthase [Xylogone sp. PMI_703]
MSPLIQDDKLYQSNAAMPIAVVGIGFRGPGDATNVENLLRMIAEGRESRTEIPKEKWNHEAFYHPDPNRFGTHNVTGGHYFQQDVSRFDAPFFNMTAAEAAALDPQQRILLECTYEAVENSGMKLHSFSGSNTSVFVGSFCADYADVLWRDAETVPMYQCTNAGHSRANTANRISYTYDLKGPSVTIDTACSASLVALHLACQSLRSGDAEQALVAGCSAILSHEGMVTMSMMRLLSPEGRCYTFDERAGGYARGDGVGAILLKPLHDALEAGDTIRAIIRGTGSNQDGKTPGITMPNGLAQEALVRSVYERVGLNPLDTSYVECHGTGTQAGDFTETSALARVFEPGRPHNEPLIIGSVKTNIGHLEGASGVAGVIKTILMLENGLILPNRNFQKGNPKILFDEWKLRVPLAVENWEIPKPRRASVNSFGYGGANAHVILENAEDYLRSHNWDFRTCTRKSAIGAVLSKSKLTCTATVLENGSATIESADSAASTPTSELSGTSTPSNSGPRGRLFVFSSFDETTGKNYVKSYERYLEDRLQIAEPDKFLDDLAYTLGERRTDHTWRTAIPAWSAEELLRKLREGITLDKANQTKNRKIGFVFTGQGAQWCGMGKELIDQYPVFKEAIERAGAACKKAGIAFDLKTELYKDPKESEINRAIYSQPLSTAVQLALVDLLASWGVRPTSVTGHSSGEIASAYAARILSLEDAMLVSCHRGIVSSSMAERAAVPGCMIAVGMSKEEILPIISTLTRGKAVVACSNSPSSVTVSGDLPAIDELHTVLDGKGVFNRKLVVQVAYHSHHMELVAEEYRKAISAIKVLPGNDVEFFSSVTGERAVPSDLGPDYWVSNMVGEVKFDDSLRRLCIETQGPSANTKKSMQRRKSKVSPVSTLIEIGPHSALAGPIKQIIQANETLNKASIKYYSALLRNKDAVTTALNLIGQLFVAGHEPNLGEVNRPTGLESHSVLIDLPPYPWNHQNSYWAESRISKFYRERRFPRTDLLGGLERNSSSIEPRWRNHIRLSEIPWVRDHKIQGNIIYPAAGYLAMAIEAACQHASTVKSIPVITGYKLREVVIDSALIIPEDPGEVEVAITLKSFTDSIRNPSDMWDEFVISSVNADSRWTEHCRGLVSVVAPQKVVNIIDGQAQQIAEKQGYAELVASYEAKCRRNINIPQFYEQLTELGLEYGPTFANLKEAKAAPNACVGELEIPDTAAVMPYNFQFSFVIHPATLDALFHTIFVALSTANGGVFKDPAVPVSAGEIFVSANITSSPGSKLATFTSTEQKDYRFMSASMTVFHETHKQQGEFRPVIEIKDLTCATLAREGADNSANGQLTRAYNLAWKPSIDLLSEAEILELCSSSGSSEAKANGINARELLERAAYYLLKRAVAGSAPSETGSTYAQNLWSFFKSQSRIASWKHAYDGWDQLFKADVDAFIERVVSSSNVGRFLGEIGGKLSKLLTGELSSAEFIKELDLRVFVDNIQLFQNTQSAAKYLELLAHKTPSLSILAVGPGSGVASLGFLSLLEKKTFAPFARYEHNDIEFDISEVVKERFPQWAHLVGTQPVDINHDIQGQQDVKTNSVDVLLAFHVLGDAAAMNNVLVQSKQLLKPDGKLLFIGRPLRSLVASVLFGYVPSVLAENVSKSECSLSSTEIESLVAENGFSKDAAISTAINSDNYSMMIASVNTPQDTSAKPQKVLVITEDESTNLGSLPTRLRGTEVTVSPLSEASPTSDHTCIVLSDLSSKAVLSDPSSQEWEALKKIMLEANGLLWVTRGGAITTTNPNGNMATGLVRTIRSERGDVPVVTLDLDAENQLNEVTTMDIIFKVFRQSFYPAFNASEVEQEYAERNGQLLIPRVVEDEELTKTLAIASDNIQPQLEPLHQPGRALRMFVGTPGLLDSIFWTDDDRIEAPLLDDWVEIEVKASGFNFKDVMMAMGQIKVENLGWECSGVLTKVGSAVSGFTIGDRVVCHASGTFCTNARVHIDNVRKIPDSMTFETAASLPVTYVTAYHSIYNIARLQKDETILVHAATGGLGQAIIELCQLIGAEIFATVGTLDKKKFLIDHFHIPEDHIFFSRDHSFASGIKRMTKGKGVDAVMNSLAGEGLRLSWECIAPYGRFVELGQRDIGINSRLEMGQFIKNTSFTAFNLAYMVQYNPKVANEVFTNVLDLFWKGAIKGPSPVEVYSFSDVEKAFRRMQTGGHMGKLVGRADADAMVKVIPLNRSKPLLRPDAAYVLVGGLGGIGRATALWMVGHGARNIIFVNRSGVKSDEARETIRVLEEMECKTAVFPCDITNEEQVKSFTEDTAKVMPPIKGVIQGAMLLRDTLFEKMSLEDYTTVLRPKVQGTWNLHKFLPKDMDFFIMESSVSGIVGNASQAAYAAGNTFLDAFATYRTSQGLPATTIDLSAISGVGYLANNSELKQAMERQGFEFTNPKRLMALIESAIRNPARPGQQAHIITGLGTWNEDSTLGALTLPLFSHFRKLCAGNTDSNKSGGGHNLKEALKAAKTLDDASELILAALVEKISSRSGIGLENINTSKSMPDYGIDSLVAVEMRNWITKDMDSTLPVLELLASDPLTHLASKIAQRSRLVRVTEQSQD